ncbi:MAG TPA: polyprenyl synthetase family protein [Kineosporiaceae bacterium]|nr:polyprenyl synthetase family protein [Kineosporiaceae bacterium]
MEVGGPFPFPFSLSDLGSENLVVGVQHTLAHFERWRQNSPTVVADHVEEYTRRLQEITAGRFRRRVRRSDDRRRAAREGRYFLAYNLGELPTPALVEHIVAGLPDRIPTAEAALAGLDGNRGASGVLDALTRYVPDLRDMPETAWLGERLDRLYRILPEPVVRAGGMGKAVRAALGVLAIGAYDTLQAGPAARREHLRRILPGAYALGAAYVIVDDTLQDLTGQHLPPQDRQWCHAAIVHGLSTGTPVDVTGMPDHPLAEELHELHTLLLDTHPFTENRHLYQAAEAMYLAQHRDSNRSAQDVVAAGGVASLYPDVFLKAGLSRVVANLLARRQPRAEDWARCLTTVFLGQLKDDLRDREEDARAGRVTPFTVPAQGSDAADGTGANPLHDLFAYEAYVVHEVFGGDAAVGEALTYFGAVKLARYLSADPRRAVDLAERYAPTPEVSRFLRLASGLDRRTLTRHEPSDTQLKERCGAALDRRSQKDVDARTFVADRLGYINAVIGDYTARNGDSGLHRIVAYALDAPGKRLRPALGLMLAAELDVDVAHVEPFIVAGELFHTASLIFDDLPAQDDASVRRGRPTAHLVFDEGSVQLAAISMISSGFGLLARLSDRYPAHRVTAVIDYLGRVLGPEHLCRGQDLDLHLHRGEAGAQPVTAAEVLRMYELKTSAAIEAALVPLMMLQDRPPEETELVRQYARHAGIVFQIRDDILDLTSSTECLGKDAGNDTGKVNMARTFGQAEAQQIMHSNLDAAVACCTQLPFDTQLLEGAVTHFARRTR